MPILEKLHRVCKLVQHVFAAMIMYEILVKIRVHIHTLNAESVNTHVSLTRLWIYFADDELRILSACINNQVCEKV